MQQNFGGIQGLNFITATNYVDASISYDFTPSLTIYAQGSNFDGEYEVLPDVPDEKAYNNIYERRFMQAPCEVLIVHGAPPSSP